MLVITGNKSQVGTSISGTSLMFTLRSKPPSYFKVNDSHPGLADTLSSGLNEQCTTDSNLTNNAA